MRASYERKIFKSEFFEALTGPTSTRRSTSPGGYNNMRASYERKIFKSEFFEALTGPSS